MPQATTTAPKAAQAPSRTNPATATPTNPATATPTAAFGQFQVPLTQQDVDALQDQRNELSNQLISANTRRNELSRSLRSARAGPDQTGLESRITQLDGRITTIEGDIAASGRALSAAPSGLIRQTSTSTGVPSGRFGQPSASQMTAITIIGMITVLMPLSIAFGRMLLRRANRPPPPQIPKDVSDRLERMEQGIEAVALEVERIGEGQRFVTQLMSDRAQRAALPEGVPRA
jgi:FtsZ-binding cell division protein ZapB